MDFRAFEATPGISVIVLPDSPVFTHVAVSNDFIRATGMKREDVIGRGHFEIFPKSPEDPNFTGDLNLKASFEYILQHKIPHEIPLQRFDIPNGDGTFSQKYWKINNAPILDDTGKVLYIIHSAIDETEQELTRQKVEEVVKLRTKELAKANEDLLKSNEELIRSNEELQQFAFVTSHDLQEPLRKIRFFIDRILSKVDVDNSIRTYADKVDGSAKRMSGLIHNLLDYSRLSADSRFEKVDLNCVLQNVLSDYELLIEQKRANITSERLPTIVASPLQMNQLLFNLIGNALKFTKRDSTPEITIYSTALTEEQKSRFGQLQMDKDYFQLCIKDNGIGFIQEYADKIFTIFQRLNDRSTFGGYGIGLALCKKVVETHNGIIYAEGKPKEGAKFTIILPYQQQ